MSKPANLLTLMLAVFSTLALTACGGGGGGQEDGTGTLSVGITDAGAEEVKEVWVRFTGVTVKPKSGSQQYYAVNPEGIVPGLSVNLMDLTDGEYELLLDKQVLPAGEYNWIALEIATNDQAEPNNLYVETDPGIVEPMELEIPSGQQSGLRLVSGFTVLANGSTDLMIDWDLKKALVMPRNGRGVWKLRPALRITDLAVYGRIEGTVSPDLFENVAACDYEPTEDEGNAVYAFKVPGEEVEPPVMFDAVMVDDIDGDPEGDTNGDDPYATAVVKWDGVSSYSYAFDYMGVGDYKLAFTCEAALDEPDTNAGELVEAGGVETAPDIEFTVLPDAVTVVDGQTTVAPQFGS